MATSPKASLLFAQFIWEAVEKEIKRGEAPPFAIPSQLLLFAPFFNACLPLTWDRCSHVPPRCSHAHAQRASSNSSTRAHMSLIVISALRCDSSTRSRMVVMSRSNLYSHFSCSPPHHTPARKPATAIASFKRLRMVLGDAPRGSSLYDVRCDERKMLTERTAVCVRHKLSPPSVSRISYSPTPHFRS